MKRNIIATIEFVNKLVSFNVLERLSNEVIEIFSQSESVSNSNSFLSESIAKVERMIGGSLQDVTVVLQPTKSVDPQIKVITETIDIANDEVTKQDVDNLIEIARRKYTELNREITLIQPLLFQVTGATSKKYSKAPIYKKGDKLSAALAITSISHGMADFVKTTVNAQKLKLSQILLTTQTITQNNLSENALVQGSVLVHTAENQTWISFNKNQGTVASGSDFEMGMRHLLSGISKVFGCDQNEARELLTIYGSFKTKDNRVIYTHQEGIKETHHTNNELTEILKAFAKREVEFIKKEYAKSGLPQYPIIFSGEVSRVEGFYDFVKGLLNQEIAIYKPLTFVEYNSAIHSVIGVSKFDNRMAEVLGKTFTSIVETNPNTIASLRKPNDDKNKKLWSRIVDKIGGKYDWN